VLVTALTRHDLVEQNQSKSLTFDFLSFLVGSGHFPHICACNGTQAQRTQLNKQLSTAVINLDGRVNHLEVKLDSVEIQLSAILEVGANNNFGKKGFSSQCKRGNGCCIFR
jgi:hypothetical protein